MNLGLAATHTPDASGRTHRGGRALTGFFDHHGMWAPGVQMFRKLHFRAILPTVFVSLLFFNGKAGTIEFSSSERVGVVNFDAALPALKAMQRQRRLILLEAATGTAPADLSEARSPVDAASRRLAEAQTAHGHQLGTAKACAGLRDEVRSLPPATSRPDPIRGAGTRRSH